MIWLLDRSRPSTISTDPISPHYGHAVATDEGQWVCVTCDPDVLDIECPNCGVVYVADVDVSMPCPYCELDPDEEEIL